MRFGHISSKRKKDVPDRPSSTGGFTLIEILLAFTLLAIIAGVGVPAYRARLERMRNDQATVQISMISMAIAEFETNHQRKPLTLAELPIDIPTDPWGTSYQYLDLDGVNPGLARKDRNLVPINTDYDLYSKGPDRDSRLPLTVPVSRDDLIRANDGRFIGRASDY